MECQRCEQFSFMGSMRMHGNRRIIGVDIARILAMYLVVVFHVVGVLSRYDKCTTTGRWVSAASFCCVDLFALISGYVGVLGRFRPSRFALLWIQVVFTGMIIVGGGALIGLWHPALKDWGKVFLPLTSHSYWYFTEYFFLFLLMPFLNAGLRQLSKRVAGTIVVAVLLFVVLLPAINPSGSDTYLLGGGLSAIWLVVCYLIGGYLQLHGPKFGCLAWLAGGALMTVAVRFWGTSYAHPATLLAAICWLMACARIDICSGRAKRIVAFFSSVAFGVYVWHAQPLLHARMVKCFDSISNYHPVLSVVLILALSILMYLVISVLEYLRIRLFKLLKVKELSERAFAWMEVKA